MGSILIVTLLLTGEPSTAPQRLAATSPNCAWEMGMYPPQAQLDSHLRGLASPGWCSEVGYVLSAGGGQHLVTRSEKEQDTFAK